eukprot:TRINITY_DN5225_c0_g1_i2.p1 TRINITY_DN5225_c0_g1~~TRINITY_DN5225_c0_g1_i2.p1  ORF type:complete len:183 (-),score=1.89 TRINITY_DN5225_c0_g1_i2:38-586(-)
MCIRDRLQVSQTCMPLHTRSKQEINYCKLGKFYRQWAEVSQPTHLYKTLKNFYNIEKSNYCENPNALTPNYRKQFDPLLRLRTLNSKNNFEQNLQKKKNRQHSPPVGTHNSEARAKLEKYNFKKQIKVKESKNNMWILTTYFFKKNSNNGCCGGRLNVKYPNTTEALANHCLLYTSPSPRDS